jgi:hypothetical protein
MLIAVAKGTLIRGAIARPRGPISARGDARAMRGRVTGTVAGPGLPKQWRGKGRAAERGPG